jgi:hypothetical protein
VEVLEAAEMAAASVGLAVEVSAAAGLAGTGSSRG